MMLDLSKYRQQMKLFELARSGLVLLILPSWWRDFHVRSDHVALTRKVGFPLLELLHCDHDGGVRLLIFENYKRCRGQIKEEGRLSCPSITEIAPALRTSHHNPNVKLNMRWNLKFVFAEAPSNSSLPCPWPHTWPLVVNLVFKALHHNEKQHMLALCSSFNFQCIVNISKSDVWCLTKSAEHSRAVPSLIAITKIVTRFPNIQHKAAFIYPRHPNSPHLKSITAIRQDGLCWLRFPLM